MRKLFSFMVTSLDGYYEGPNGEFDWPGLDAEFNEFSISQMNDMDTLLFGRATYEGMEQYWTSPEAVEFDPDITARMNGITKFVFSSSLAEATWANTTLVSDDPVTAIAQLKQEPGQDMALFGSPTLTASLLEQGLVDEVRVMVAPLLWGGGPSLYPGLSGRIDLELMRTTTFRNGLVLLVYRPTPKEG
jgi:dihydrofolate reductase